MALPGYAMVLSAVCDCGISILLNFESFLAWAEMLPVGSFTHNVLLRCAKYLSKACAWPPRSTSLRLPVQIFG